MTVFWRQLPKDVQTRIGYAIAGMAIGALWLAQAGHPPLEHALRLLAIMAVVMAVSTAVRWWAQRRGQQLPRHPIGRFLVAKLGLVAAAAAAVMTLGQWVPGIDVWVAVGLFVVVAVGGPPIHPWLLNPSHDIERATAAVAGGGQRR